MRATIHDRASVDPGTPAASAMDWKAATSSGFSRIEYTVERPRFGRVILALSGVGVATAAY
jgi:hypothetical protein